MIEIYDALKIAIELLRARRLMFRQEYRLTVSRIDHQWVFWFVFLPETPGLDITVNVSDDGSVRVLQGI